MLQYKRHNFGATIDIYVYVKIGRAQLPATSLYSWTGYLKLIPDTFQPQPFFRDNEVFYK